MAPSDGLLEIASESPKSKMGIDFRRAILLMGGSTPSIEFIGDRFPGESLSADSLGMGLPSFFRSPIEGELSPSSFVTLSAAAEKSVDRGSGASRIDSNINQRNVS